MKLQMKLLAISLFLLITNSTYSQKLVENRVDDFKGYSVKATTWEKIAEGLRIGATMAIRLRKIDSTNVLDVKIMRYDLQAFAVSKGSELLFKLTNGKILSLKSIEYAISSYGAGATGFVGSKAMGIEISYYVTNDDLHELANNIVNKIRFYANDGYVDLDITDKKAVTIVKTAALM